MYSLASSYAQSYFGKVFDSDDEGGDFGADEDDKEVVYDKFGNVMDRAAIERAALQEAREKARAARAAKARRTFFFLFPAKKLT